MRRAIAIIGLLVASAAGAETSTEWDPIDDALLAETESVLDPTADAEYVFDHTRIWDTYRNGSTSSHRRHIVRKKIWTAAGAEEHGQIELTRESGVTITQVRGRTVKPDGRILTLEKKDIFERRMAGDDEDSLDTVSFVLPGVEAGDVIDYQWKATHSDSFVSYLPLSYHRSVPARQVAYELKPVSLASLDMQVHTFNAEIEPKRLRGDFVFLGVRDRPAAVVEPLSPPWMDTEAWSLAYYTVGKRETPTEFWDSVASSTHEIMEDCLTRNKPLRLEAARVLAVTKDRREQLRLLSQFVRGLIKPKGEVTGWSALPYATRPGWERPNNRAVLKRGDGVRRDIILLFCDAAREAGFDVRLGLAEGRDLARFDPKVPTDYFLPRLLACVREGEDWLVLDPSADDLPFLMFPWTLQRAHVLVTGPKGHEIVRLPQSKPADSRRRTSGTFALNTDGDLSGEMKVVLTGPRAARWRRYHYRGHDAADTAKVLAENLVEDAEWSELEIKGLGDPEGELAFSGRLLVEGHAQSTGKRLFFQPALLHRDSKPLFTSDERVHPIRFPQAWLDLDSYSITPPEGYELESADAPAFQHAPGVAKHETRILQAADGTLRFSRTFAFGIDGNLEFVAEMQPTLRVLFDGVHAADTHVLTFRRSDEPKASDG